ncbi:hypothetical protein JTE90_018300 [Oedothorax gibbosus]|uniref:Uncharacterized protein n=1 Tax=Oedothorax gibbosus TaxID=931172 RepID=A0AAV6UD62_9ARAC|nr:hypothetical protein JTE90_018300 [Oedothorax gibbosus]
MLYHLATSKTREARHGLYNAMYTIQSSINYSKTSAAKIRPRDNSVRPAESLTNLHRVLPLKMRQMKVCLKPARNWVIDQN